MPKQALVGHVVNRKQRVNALIARVLSAMEFAQVDGGETGLPIVQV